jgi:hypothetical protein
MRQLKRQQQQTQKLTQKEQENKTLKETLQAKHIKEKIADWKRPAYWFIPVIILILVFFYLQIFNCDWEYNYVQQLANYIDNNPSETKRDWLRIIINGGLLSGLLSLVVIAYNRLISKEKKEEKIKSLNDKMPEEYK